MIVLRREGNPVSTFWSAWLSYVHWLCSYCLAEYTCTDLCSYCLAEYTCTDSCSYCLAECTCWFVQLLPGWVYVHWFVQLCVHWFVHLHLCKHLSWAEDQWAACWVASWISAASLILMQLPSIFFYLQLKSHDDPTGIERTMHKVSRLVEPQLLMLFGTILCVLWTLAAYILIESSVFQRQCCGPGRAFSMSITDNSQREVSG